MDSSRGEKSEVNPPTVYRPEAVDSAPINNPTVDSVRQPVHPKPTFLGSFVLQFDILAEYFRADGRNVFAKGEKSPQTESLPAGISLRTPQFVSLESSNFADLTGPALITILLLRLFPNIPAH